MVKDTEIEIDYETWVGENRAFVEATVYRSEDGDDVDINAVTLMDENGKMVIPLEIDNLAEFKRVNGHDVYEPLEISLIEQALDRV